MYVCMCVCRKNHIHVGLNSSKTLLFKDQLYVELNGITVFLKIENN